MCFIENKPFENTPLIDFINENPWTAGYKYDGNFPLIIKLIDAQDNLSVQVHPTGKNCKNEMWYILDCDEDSYILYGLKEDISKQDFKNHIINGTVTDLMNKVPVHKGDVFYIKAGTLHAIGKGIVVAEIQQSSNVTYRIYDYNRRDKYGNTRPLHINEALEVINFNHQPEIYHKTYVKDNIRLLNRCEYFYVYEITVKSQQIICVDKSSFSSVIIIEGFGTVSSCPQNNTEPFKAGDSFFLASGCDFIINGKSKIILTTKSPNQYKF
jgi:mannose-6-phosphate isomerase